MFRTDAAYLAHNLQKDFTGAGGIDHFVAAYAKNPPFISFWALTFLPLKRCVML